MSAVLGKIAAALLTDKRVLKAIGGIILGILVIIITPATAVIALLNGDMKVDINALQEQIEAQMTEEEKARLQFVEDTMHAIEEAMTEAGFPERVKEAQVLYVLALSDYAHEEDFVTKLAGCFAADQTDEQLTLAVSDAFGTEISEDDFAKVMAGIRATYIDTSDYTDPATKNNLDLARWAVHAEKAGWGYVWGTSGGVLTKKAFEAQKQQYPEEVGGYEDFIKKNWLGKRTADCSGLIRGYQWLNPETNQVEPGSNGIPAMSADAMYQAAEEKGAVGTIPEIPGLAVWRTGHIGIYLGNGEVIEAKGTEYGVVKTELASGSWTHWLKVPYITYVNEEEKDGGE